MYPSARDLGIQKGPFQGPPGAAEKLLSSTLPGRQVWGWHTRRGLGARLQEGLAWPDPGPFTALPGAVKGAQ